MNPYLSGFGETQHFIKLYSAPKQVFVKYVFHTLLCFSACFGVASVTFCLSTMASNQA